ncbi:MAG TPA: hypothetical protein VK886_10590 [Vicinamibacterales bacterium]|nr:hypothetical protein [Vicinamibacterales bacterium]
MRHAIVSILFVLLAGLAPLAQQKPAPAQATDADVFAGLKARSIGPAGMSGRVATVAADPSDPDTLYVGAATGGVWKSANGGATWEPLFDDQPVHAIGAIAVAPSNPSVIWVGTGEGNVRNSVSIGNGVYRSLDAGRTWQHMGLDRTERVYRIAIHPADPDVVFVCAPGQEWSENKERGVFRTRDGGRSWTHVLSVDERTGCGDLVMDPSNPDKLFASMWEFRRWPWFFRSGGPGSGLHVTHDGGGTWRKLQEEDGLPKAPYGRIGLAISASNPETVYAMVEAPQSALIRSDDSGRRWRSVNARPNVNPRPFYFGDITVDPQRPDRLYSIDYEIRVSDDGGKTFQTLPGASWAQLHGDYHALWIDPRNPEFMLAGNDGGIGISRDRGKTFRFAGNLPLAQYYHVAVDNETPYNIYGGLQDNGSWRGPSNVWRRGGIRNYDWLEVGGGDGFETLPHPKDPTIGYSLWQGGNVMRWNIRTGEEKLVKPAAPEGVKLRFNWNAGLATDPFEADTVYLGSQFVHRSTDRGETWTIVSPDLTSNNPDWQKSDQSGGITPDVTAAENFTTIVAIAPSAKQRGVIWVGSDDGRIHVTRDDGQTWTSVEKNVSGVPANTWVPHIEPSQHDAATAFAVFDNHRRGDAKPYAYRTDDYGRTWQSLVGGDAGVQGYALVLRQDPVERNLLFLGTEFGLYFSADGGRRWTHMKKTLPTASVMDLAIHPRDHDLVIGTHGRAIWVLDDIRPLRAMTEGALKAPLTLYPIAPAQQHWSRAEEGGFGFGATEFRGGARRYGAILTYSMNLPDLPLQDEERERARKEKERQTRLEGEARREATVQAKPEKTETPPAPERKEEEKKGEATEERPQVDITITDAAGKVVRRFKAPAAQGVNRAAWDLSSDARRQAPRPEDAPPPEREPSGPEVPPGDYTVTMKYGTHEAKQAVRVLADPRSKNTTEDWQRRWEAVGRLGALNDAAVEGIWRVRRTRQDVNTIQEKLRQRARDAGERDAKKIDEHPTIAAGTKLVERLNALEKRLWVSPETVGIVADVDVYSDATRAGWSILSSWDPPNPTQMEYLRQGEAKLRAFLEELNAFFGREVAEFRKLAADVQLLGATAPIEIK